MSERPGLLLIISGPSGVGKTTITRGVERALDDAIFSVSVTTRPKTAADVEGVDYQFVDDHYFDRMASAGDLLEHATVFGNKYGTPKRWVEDQLARGRVVILEIDVQGATQIKRAVPGALAVFILPPDEETLLARLRGRRRDTEDVIQRRFAEARREMDAAERSGAYDVFITNDVLERVIGEIVARVESRRQTRPQAHRARGDA